MQALLEFCNLEISRVREELDTVNPADVAAVASKQATVRTYKALSAMINPRPIP